LTSKSIVKIIAKLIYSNVLKYNKSIDNKNKASNILIKALDKFCSKLKRYNLNIVASIFVEIIQLSFEILKQVIYC